MNAYQQGESTDDNALLKRRLQNAGALSVLFYQKPIEMISASGVWMTAADGSRYLDLYNNVPSVGHCHPKVVEAVTRQTAQLNTNTRYLNDIVETYLERLKITLPTMLDAIVLCCSGSEANDMALRIARKATGQHGIVVTEAAYHGNTAAVTEVSPSAYRRDQPPAWVEMVPAPSRRAYGNNITGGFKRAVLNAIFRLKQKGFGFAGFMADTIFSSDGVFTEPARFLLSIQQLVHEYNGLYIADEVQPGFGRTGNHFWGFQSHLLTPDIVTMGKPMGNGYPLAGLATRANLIELFSRDAGYFNTFGGNTVAAAAGLAVLDVIEEESLMANALAVGNSLKSALISIAQNNDCIADVRGQGLYLGIDIEKNGEPDASAASRIIENLRQRHIMIGAAGLFGHTLKVRPPLCLELNEAAHFIEQFSEVMEHKSVECRKQKHE